MPRAKTRPKSIDMGLSLPKGMGAPYLGNARDMGILLGGDSFLEKVAAVGRLGYSAKSCVDVFNYLLDANGFRH